jgi:protoheme IX farnesyltransferase
MSTVLQPIPNAAKPASTAALKDGIAVAARDFCELIKLRVTSLIVMTAWTGFYFGAQKSGIPSLSWTLVHALLGIGLVSGGTAALNEVIERQADALMRRTAHRPLPSGRMGVLRATVIASGMVVGGAAYLALTANLLTGALSLLTALVYLVAYTPLKKVSPICTFVGAFPGAMPPVLGWTAIRGGFDWEALVLFAIVFLWQFPHFLSIAWLYREDYQRAQIRMRPAVESDGSSTGREILAYSLALIPVSLAPSFMGMSGTVYLFGALMMSLGLFWAGLRLAQLRRPITAPQSKLRARQLLQATVIYLPLLFALMMLNLA